MGVNKTKDDLLKRLLRLAPQVQEGNVSPAITGEFNLILVLVNDQLQLDLRQLSIKLGEHTIPFPPRHADDQRPVTAEEQSQFYADGNMFRTRLQEAVNRLNGYDPPRDSIGFVR